MKLKLQKLKHHTWELEFSDIPGEEHLPQDYHGTGQSGTPRQGITAAVKEEVETVFGRFHMFLQTSGAGYAAWEFLGERDETKIFEAAEHIACRLKMELQL